MATGPRKQQPVCPGTSAESEQSRLPGKSPTAGGKKAGDGSVILPITRGRTLPGRNGSTRPLRVLITGGAGFVGTNLASRLLQSGHRVILLDNMSRPGVEENVQWLTRHYGETLDVRPGDVRDEKTVRQAVEVVDRVYHFAAQVAVTTSLVDPAMDFAVNAQGMIHVLEAVRAQSSPPPILFTSTNKVYGDLGQVRFVERALRYEPVARRLKDYGVSESQPLDFHSPYGCSKGSADQYMLDFARCFRVPAVVFRMSCIYGPHQCGTEDQGWVAHFLLQAMRDKPITVFGDGKQVRDILYVDDLTEALTLALDNIEITRGRAFNIGGGPDRTISLLELIDMIEVLRKEAVHVHFEDARQGDQRFYVSDIRQFTALTQWQPETTVQKGIRQLADWLLRNRVDVVPYAPAVSRLGGLSQLQQATISIEKAR